MKYTIEGFSQEAALALKKETVVNGKEKILKLDVIDLMLLRWFVDFYPKMNKKIIGEIQYAWVNYQSIVNDLPLLGLEKTPIYRRFSKMCELGILIHYHDKTGGSFSYYGYGENYIKLIDTEYSKTATIEQDTYQYDPKSIPPTIQKSDPYDSKVIPPMIQKSDPLRFKSSSKDSSINNSSIINKEKSKKEKNETKEKFEIKKSLKQLIEKYTQNQDLQNVLIEFVNMRNLKKKPMTNFAFERMVKRLDDISGNDDTNKIELISTAIEHCWDTVYATNYSNQYNNKKASYDIDEYEKTTSNMTKEQLDMYYLGKSEKEYWEQDLHMPYEENNNA